MTSDPYAPYLRQADDLLAQGETVKAGQIWQAILKQQPSHAEARERLLAVKQRLLALREAEAAALRQAPPAAPPVAVPEPAPSPAPLPPSAPVLEAPVPAPPEAPPEPSWPEAPPAPARTAPDPERLVAEGCTLFDMGQFEDARGKWEQALALNPAHPLARGYANSARRELDLPALQAPAAEGPAPVEDRPQDEDIDKLLREAVQLYDMGLVEEAITKWEQILTREPHREEIVGYLRQARAVVVTAPPEAPAAPLAAPAGAGAPEFEGLDLKLRQAEHLLTLHRPEEAAFTFQQALGLDPGNARALEGLERCRKPSDAGPDHPATERTSPGIPFDAQGRIAMATEEARFSEPEGVEPPALLLKAAPAPREGLSMPGRLRGTTERMPWLKSPRLLAGVGGGVLLLALGLGVAHSYRMDRVLKEEVQAARAAAVAPVAEQAQAPDLSESPAAIRQEAEAALGSDPLRAYLRAETLVGRNPGDPAGAQLLEKAKAGLAGAPAGASQTEYQKHLQNGDLEAALRVIDALLRNQPDDATLRAQAGRLHLALCTAHAGRAKWDQAQEDLLRGRALFPADKTWQTRLKLLERVKALPKNQQEAWISLLG